MKQNIPTGVYTHLQSTYIPLLEGGGCTCENCGRLISNIVTVKHESGRQYTIGADCAKTILSKQDQKESDATIKKQTRVSKKIAELKKYSKSFVICPTSGVPCHPPETRGGYMIPY